MKKAAFAAGLLLTLAVAGHAEFFAGNKLASDWQEYKKYTAGVDYEVFAAYHYIGYVTGVTDVYCGVIDIPNGATVGQICSIVGKWLEDHPEEWNFTADVLVYRALLKAFGKK